MQTAKFASAAHDPKKVIWATSTTAGNLPLTRRITMAAVEDIFVFLQTDIRAARGVHRRSAFRASSG